MDRQRLGFIGLGVMGGHMAGHLAAAGHGLTAYDISPAALDRLKAQHPGVAIAASPREVAAASDIVITMLPSGLPVQEAVTGPNGMLEGFRPGCLLIDTSSSAPWHTTRTAEILAEAGVAMVDAPVSGAEAGAQAAALVFMVGGAPADVARAAPLLDILGKAMFHLGPIGSGHAMKSINNLITAATFMATAEGLIAGKRYGLDPAVMTEVLNESTGMSWISRTQIARRILSRAFDDTFKLDLMVKDIDIALKVATDQDLDLPLLTRAQALWHESQDRLERGASVSALVRTLEQKTGVDLTPGSNRT